MKRNCIRLALPIAGCMALVIANDAIASGVSFTGLGDLVGDDFNSVAFGVSADGSVVAGIGSIAGGDEAFRWTRSEGLNGLGVLPNSSPYSIAYGISADGGSIVGTSHFGGPGEADAIRWNVGGMLGLGDLSGGRDSSTAYDVSADGSVVVGRGNTATANEAIIWTSQDGVVGLGHLPDGRRDTFARGVSNDGSVVAGYSFGHPDGSCLPPVLCSTQAFRWTADDGMVGLGDLAGGDFTSTAFGISGDGDVIVGYSLSGLGNEAFRWTSAGGMVGLGDLADGLFQSFAQGVSLDGSVIVGRGNGALGDEAFVWTAENGMQRLMDILIAGGVSGLDDWTLTHAMGISDDGTTVVGTGFNPDGNREAFVANISTVPVPSAVWLFVSALGLLGWMRRKKAS